MLLLFLLWDDWSIFMISCSNEQLQQELEYTLPKPDCHSWWISKMQSYTLEERYAIKFCFKLGKNATETYGMLQTTFGASCMNRASVFEWHKRFKEGRESVRESERCGRSKEVNMPELIGQKVRVRVTNFKSGRWHFHRDNVLYFDLRPGPKILFQGIEIDCVGGLRFMIWDKVKVSLCHYSHALEESNLWTAWQLFPLDDD